MAEPDKVVEKEPEVVVKGLVLDDQQKAAYVAAHHEALVGRQNDYIIAGIQLALSKGMHPNDFAVVVFDVEDPHAPEAVVEKMREKGLGYAVKVFTRRELSEFLAAYEQPAPEADVKWSTKARVYVSDKRVVTDYPKYKPYLQAAKDVLLPQPEDTFMVCTFTYGGMRTIDALVRPNKEPDQGAAAGRQ